MKITSVLKIGMQANWDEEYLTQVGIFFIETCKRDEKCLTQVRRPT